MLIYPRVSGMAHTQKRAQMNLPRSESKDTAGLPNGFLQTAEFVKANTCSQYQLMASGSSTSAQSLVELTVQDTCFQSRAMVVTTQLRASLFASGRGHFQLGRTLWPCELHSDSRNQPWILLFSNASA